MKTFNVQVQLSLTLNGDVIKLGGFVGLDSWLDFMQEIYKSLSSRGKDYVWTGLDKAVGFLYKTEEKNYVTE